MSLPGLVSRLERFGRVGSTQEIVRAWLADGVPEVCLALADEQTAGRGRLDRRWQAGPGQAFLVSAGFRPADVAMAHAWRLPAIAALSMLEAAEALLGKPPGRTDRLALKWPNDIVAVHEGRVRKVGGVLSEGLAEGERLAAAVVGIGVNTDWPATDFPPELADSMWSLHEVAGHAVDRETLLALWLGHLASRYEELAAGRFGVPDWTAAQVTTGAALEVDLGQARLSGRGVGVDPESGALLLAVDAGPPRRIAVGEVVSCRVGQVRAHL